VRPFLIAYADTSFLASLYIPDANSVEAARQMQRQSLPVLITALGELELVNAIQLRLFRREVRLSEARAANAAFRTDLRDGVFAIRALPEDVYARARQLASKWSVKLGTRSLDIMHVAAAVGLRANVLHSFDARQRRLAEAVKLKIS
jgi:predicted nucleic acid-binding protein